MERALWNNQSYYASKISESYEMEKNIRKASTHKELICPDPDCTKPVLRYCHGPIKGAFFAHLGNCNCDYAKFDNANTQLMRQVKCMLYDKFSLQEYEVKMDVKVFSHHYTHLLFTFQNGKKIALELGTQKTTANEIDKLFELYNKFGITVKWIIISDDNTPIKEDKTFFLKRYLLNENKHKDALILDWNCLEVTQYIVDPNKYMFSGREIRIDNYPDTYTETVSLTELTFEDEELTIKGFYKRYDEWLLKKRTLFEEKIANIENEIYEQSKHSKYFEEEHKQLKYTQTLKSTEISNSSNQSINNSTKSENNLLQMLSSGNPFYDTFGYKLRLCLHCDKVKRAMFFDPYTFYYKNQNLGICKECKKNNIPKKQ